ncbi:peptidoglycan D,D-transpeptidase FtsI family protein [Robbsia andropogonis]|uniref:peptidoglycan D,D-transpeptidase FtsI family protein n=1 Tax=Robbsia andropogonis TaxID=28092 RepID=UPI000464EC24|nr:penicillin-binding protein 2 [Robbsia andropogonis]
MKKQPDTPLRARRSDRGVQFSSSPMLSVSLPMWRSKLVVFLIFLAFVALAGRAFWIQGPGNAFYQRQGASRFERTIELPASRGKIMDRNGLMLATTLPVRAIWAVPDDVPEDLPASKRDALAKLLDVDSKELRVKLSRNSMFAYIKRQVPIETADKVMALDIPGIHQNVEYKRYYPEGEITAQLVGFTDINDEGQDGVELAMQNQLVGAPGSRRVIKDRLGHIVQDVDELTVPRDGKDMRLSIDSKIQYITFNELKNAVVDNKAAAGAAVVVDARTGEVLALANYPTYNPNDRSHLTGEQLRNRVFTDSFEPGSIMKPFTLSLALDLHRVTPNTIVNTAPGSYSLDGARITDDADFGTLTVGGVLQKSSNVGTSKIAMQLRPEEQWNMYTSLGFGVAPNIGFPGAVAGRLRPWKSWRRIEQATMSYGYGLSVSLFQLAHAYTVFTNNGRELPLSLYKLDGAPQSGPQVFEPKTMAELRTMLASVVGPGGTAPLARVPGYTVGGKTGTAYKHFAHGYDKSRYRASFVGIAPMSNPRIIVAVSVDDPRGGKHFGGQVSAPVFSTIAGEILRALNVAPDAPFKQTVAAVSPTVQPGVSGPAPRAVAQATTGGAHVVRAALYDGGTVHAPHGYAASAHESYARKVMR